MRRRMHVLIVEHAVGCDPLRLTLLLLAVAVFSTGPALAQWETRPYGVPLTRALGNQDDPDIISDGSGGAIVVWRDLRNGLGYDLYAQRVDASGVVQWTLDGVPVAVEVNRQYGHVLLPDGAGGTIMAWIDERSGDFDIYGQRLDSAGAPQWTVNGIVLCDAVEDQNGPMVAEDGAGGAIVAWTDPRGGSVSVADVYAQRVNGDGIVQWTANGIPVCSATGRQGSPRGVTLEGDSSLVLTWPDLRNGGGWDLFSQKIDTAGVGQWTTNGEAVATGPESQWAAASVPDGAGGVITIWKDSSGGNSDIYAQRIDASGTPLWVAGGVPIAVAPNNKFALGIVSDGAGGAIAAWHDYRSGSSDIYVQRIDGSGAPLWTVNGIGLCTADDRQDNPVIVSDGYGGAIVAWIDHRRGTNWDLYVQQVDASGARRWTDPDEVDGLLFSIAPNSIPFDFDMVSDGAGGAIITWADVRDGGYDLFAQHLEADPDVVAVDEATRPQPFVVRGVWPNPFSQRAVLEVALTSPATVTVDLFDVAGRRVRSASRRDVEGVQNFALDGRDQLGRPLANGVYYCRITAAGVSSTVKVAIAR